MTNTNEAAPSGRSNEQEARQASVDDALGHLGAALVQAIPSDDQIIIGHIRSAYLLLGGTLTKAMGA